MNHGPVLEITEAVGLHFIRALGRGVVRGVRTSLAAMVVTALIAFPLVALLGVGATTITGLITLAAVVGLFYGATRDRDHIPPAAAVTIGADGITAQNERFVRFYAWSDIHGSQVQGTELSLKVSGGYAFRVPFRSRERVFAAQERILSERKAHRERVATGAREQRDAVEPGEEQLFIDRQRRRLAAGYRQGHETVPNLCAELADPDFQLQQRLGAAIALAESSDPGARAALMEARQLTASLIFRSTLDGLLEGSADDAALVDAIHAMHPAPRRFAPVGAAGKISPDHPESWSRETPEPKDPYDRSLHPVCGNQAQPILRALLRRCGSSD